MKDLPMSHLNLIDVFWHQDQLPIEKFGHFEPFHRVNQLPGVDLTLRKDEFYKRVERMMAMFPHDFKICPQSWLFPQQLQDKDQKEQKELTGRKELLLVKPVHGQADPYKAKDCLLLHQELDDAMLILKNSHQ